MPVQSTSLFPLGLVFVWLLNPTTGWAVQRGVTAIVVYYLSLHLFLSSLRYGIPDKRWSKSVW